MIPTDIARALDAAILVPSLTRSEAESAILHCIALRALTVCVRPCDIPLAKSLCAGTETGVCTVLAFPHGVSLPESKADEARRCVALGADEVDMVANYGLARSGLWDLARADIAAVSEVTHGAGIPLKVILETAQLDLPTVAQLTEICIGAKADFVKTSTGFNGDGATEEGVATMVQTAAGRIKVKASGGIRDRTRAERFLALGAVRLGVGYTSCEAICRGESASSASAGTY